MDAHTRLAVLLGDPVAHSRSPQIHHAAFAALGLNAVYLACRVAAPDLPDAVRGLRALGVLGANVTLPHKQAVVALLDDLTPAARAIGAVNCIVPLPDGRLQGDNTDAPGFLEPLAPLADALAGQPAVVFGAGGAARAAVYALLTTVAPTALTLAVRDVAKGESLAASLAAYDPRRVLRVVPLAEAAPAVRAAALVVNTTPLGMHPHADTTPWPAAADFRPGQVVYDLVYAPAETRLLRDAAAHGATPVGGLAMLLGQAAAAFTRWTGQPFPHAAVQQALGLP